MMDLENYKEIWQEQRENTRLSKEELHSISQKKSITLAKWILIVAILEFTFFNVINFYFFSNSMMSDYTFDSLDYFDIAVKCITFIVNIYFMIIFYMNYIKIKTVDSALGVMQNILKINKTVKFYFYFNILTFLSHLIYMIGVVFFDEEQELFYKLFLPIFSIVIVSLAMWLYYIFYKITYGRLVKKLKINYEELSSV